LLECTEVGNGAGKASTYRLCLESPHYPNHTPSGKCLIENCAVHGSTDDDENRAVQGSIVGKKNSAVQGSTDATKTVLPSTENCAVKTENCAVQEEKLCCENQKLCCVGQHDTKYSPRDPHISTNQPTLQPARAREAQPGTSENPVGGLDGGLVGSSSS